MRDYESIKREYLSVLTKIGLQKSFYHKTVQSKVDQSTASHSGDKDTRGFGVQKRKGLIQHRKGMLMRLPLGS